MKKIAVLFIIFATLIVNVCGQETPVTASMSHYFRTPSVEPGIHNIVLQNRCGNRLTIIMQEEETELEFTYKPNAFRRKDLWARNFSDRDNFTSLFEKVSFPFIRADYVKEFGYDPFQTILKTLVPSQAVNNLSFLNLADENAFIVTATSPLLIAIRPKVRFDIQNGLLTESFTERGENIISYVRFPGFSQNRFRMLKDGTVVLQVMENDVVIFGGEENIHQVDRVVNRFDSMTYAQINADNEQTLSKVMQKSTFNYTNSDFQKVLDINKRIVYSAFDEGGAVNGALARIYYLIWNRDGSMSSSLMAMGGVPDLVKLWAPFILHNPSWMLINPETGERSPEYLQILGTRWTKSEDDGIYYALLSVYTHFMSTGSDELIKTDDFTQLLGAIDRFIDKTWEADKKMIGSDTRGETSLRSSPFYGYDAVNGMMYTDLRGNNVEHTTLSRSYSLYNQVNSYNLLRMVMILMEHRTEGIGTRYDRYAKIAGDLENTIRTKFKDDKGYLYSGFEILSDSSEHWRRFERGADYWEYAWAVSLGPFFPALDLQIESARMTQKTWPSIRSYGYCPWNTLAGFLYEYGMNSDEYESMLSQEVKEALMLTKRYTMPGAVTEYQGAVEGWRALPFQIGALYYSMGYQLLHALPEGLSVRASQNVNSLNGFCYRDHTFNATADGKGDDVASFTLNGERITGTLQIPEDRMRTGLNGIFVNRTKRCDEVRLRSSDAVLHGFSDSNGKLTFLIHATWKAHLVFDNLDKATSVKITNAASGEVIRFEKSVLPVKGTSMLAFEGTGDYSIVVER